MAQHKCHKEIKLNDTQGHILSFTIIFGSLISAVYFFGGWGRHFDNENDDEWYLAKNPKWDLNMYLFRIKPQPKTPKQSWDEELTRSYKETIIERLRTDNDFWIEVFTAYDNAKNDEIKPQPKEPQYLYVYLHDDYEFSPIDLKTTEWTYIGKIKLEE